MAELLYTVRCKGSRCKKILGKVDELGVLHTESHRKGNWIKTEMEKGIVECKKCNNRVKWDAANFNKDNFNENKEGETS